MCLITSSCIGSSHIAVQLAIGEGRRSRRCALRHQGAPHHCFVSVNLLTHSTLAHKLAHSLILRYQGGCHIVASCHRFLTQHWPPTRFAGCNGGGWGRGNHIRVEFLVLVPFIISTAVRDLSDPIKDEIVNFWNFLGRSVSILSCVLPKPSALRNR